MVGISVTPDGANLRVLPQQLHRRVHSLDKPLGGRRVCVAQMERLALEVPLEQRALRDWRQRLLRARRATSCRTRSVSFAVQGVVGSKLGHGLETVTERDVSFEKQAQRFALGSEGA